MNRFSGLALGAVVLAATAGTPLPAQQGGPQFRTGWGAEPPRFDYFVSSFRAAADGTGEDAVGGRLMWPVERLPRTHLGGYLIHTSEDERGSSAWRVGAQADFRVMATPLLGGRVDPLLSLGAGVVRSEAVPPAIPAAVRAPGAPLLLPPHRSTGLSVAPGIGVRLRLLPSLGLRGDARQVLDFRDGVRSNLELSGGLSIGA